MRAVVQRVSGASVSVEGAVRGSCGRGLVVLLGIARDDGAETAERLAAKVARLRVFEEPGGRLDRSLVDVGGEALVVSQFTLLADTSRGRRPSFIRAAPPDIGNELYQRFTAAVEALGVTVARGVFGAEMQVGLINDGPMTIWLDSEAG